MAESGSKRFDPKLPAKMIAVSAVDHPDLDDWVIEEAKVEALRSGWQLAEYLGREDVLPEPRSPDLCCHLFAAWSPS